MRFATELLYGGVNWSPENSLERINRTYLLFNTNHPMNMLTTSPPLLNVHMNGHGNTIDEFCIVG